MQNLFLSGVAGTHHIFLCPNYVLTNYIFLIVFRVCSDTNILLSKYAVTYKLTMFYFFMFLQSQLNDSPCCPLCHVLVKHVGSAFSMSDSFTIFISIYKCCIMLLWFYNDDEV